MKQEVDYINEEHGTTFTGISPYSHYNGGHNSLKKYSWVIGKELSNGMGYFVYYDNQNRAVSEQLKNVKGFLDNEPVKGLKQAIKEFNNAYDKAVAFIFLDVKNKKTFVESFDKHVDMPYYGDDDSIILFPWEPINNKRMLLVEKSERLLEEVALKAFDLYEKSGELLNDKYILEAFDKITA